MKPKGYFLLMLLLGLVAFPARGQEVIVSAAASLKDALTELAPLCQKQTGVAFTTNLGASGALAQQIKAGAPADVFISADDASMDELDKASLLQPGTRTKLLGNALVIVVPVTDKANYDRPAFLAQPEIKHIAIGDPKTVPAGRYASAYLDKLQLTTAVKDKLVPLDNVRTVLAAVAAGNAEAGLVYRTDAMIEKKVRIAWTVPMADGPAINYPIAVLKNTKAPANAAKVREFLLSDAARTVFDKYGFILPDKAVSPKPMTAAASASATASAK